MVFGWLLEDDFFDFMSNPSEGDGILVLWDNGITSKKDSYDRFFNTRFEYSEPDCPYCREVRRHFVLTKNRYRCSNKKCKKYFNIVTNTFLENSKIDYCYWNRLTFLLGEMKITNSQQISRDLNISVSDVIEMLKVVRYAHKKVTTKNFTNQNDILKFESHITILEILMTRTNILPNKAIVANDTILYSFPHND